MASNESYEVAPKKLPQLKQGAASEASPNNPISNVIIDHATAGPGELQVDTVDDWSKSEPAQRTSQESISSSFVRREGPPASHGSATSSHTNISVADSLSTAKALGTAEQKNGDVQDLICVGFGPASLAIAIALADIYSKSPRPLPNVLFIERQRIFSWHSGMQLPSTKMQISFLKDLATPRDPTSPFTFINYLHKHGRLNHFINLSTFLPTRAEYEAYMRWCATYFESAVKYGRQVTSVEPDDINPATQRVRTFKVKWQAIDETDHGFVSARNVVVALGGKAFIPEIFGPFTAGPYPKVKHSSQYATTVKWLESILRRPSSLSQQREARAEALSVLKNKRRESHHVENVVTKNDEIISVERPAHFHSEANHIAELEQEISSLLKEEESCNSFLKEVGLNSGRQRFVVVGSGQSAAEIFSDLCTRFPDADVSLVFKDTALRPSDDSPL
jgi:lysine/ornithine N-monooxygenase